MNAAMKFEHPCRRLTVCKGGLMFGDEVTEPTTIELKDGSALVDCYLAHTFVQVKDAAYAKVICCYFKPNG